MSNQVIEGFVTKIYEKSGTNARGAWTAFSFRLAKADGSLDPMFYQLGFNKAPGFKSDEQTQGNGDYIRFEARPKDEKAMSVIEGTVKRAKNAPARTKPQPQEKKGGWGGKGGGGPKEKVSAIFGKIGGYNTEDDVKRMCLANSRDAALAAITVLIANDALPITGAKTKAAQAQRYDEITAAIDKLTVKYFTDMASGRLLAEVADEKGAPAPAPLPDDADVAEEASEQSESDEDVSFEITEDTDDDFESAN